MLNGFITPYDVHWSVVVKLHNYRLEGARPSNI
ncbi:hypothetical protein MMA231_01607 [Asticcacaulis sp. MM231]